MRVPVVDSQGVKLKPCSSPKARILIRKGKALPRRDRNGKFYIQLTTAKSPGQPGRPPRPRAAASHTITHARTRQSRAAAYVEQQMRLFDALVAQNGYAAVRLDQLVVIDLELTCWESTPPEGQESEIIEIGLCLVDIQTGAQTNKQSILIKPERSQVSPFCSELTTLTQAQVDEGVSFAEACNLLQQQYDTCNRLWASYGDYDRRKFEQQCEQRGIPYPFSPLHVNIRTLSAQVQATHREAGLLKAMDSMGLSLEGSHHRGVDDAWNAGRLIAALIAQRRGDYSEDNKPC